MTKFVIVSDHTLEYSVHCSTPVSSLFELFVAATIGLDANGVGTIRLLSSQI